MLQDWPESTDPQKFVYEDIAIAAYLLVSTASCNWSILGETIYRVHTLPVDQNVMTFS